MTEETAKDSTTQPLPEKKEKKVVEDGLNTEEDDAKLKEFTVEEVAKHNTEEDLWVILYNRVYDMTEFQIDHPGGPDVLQDIAGQDASEEFENILHTRKARKMAKSHLIGKIKGKEVGDLFPADIAGPPSSSGDGGNSMSLTVLVMIIFTAIIAYIFQDEFRKYL
eukprot:230786_1